MLWAPQMPALDAFRVLRYDHGGHGGSPAPRGPYTVDDLGADVLALLDTLGLARVSYCGVSLAGMEPPGVVTAALLDHLGS